MKRRLIDTALFGIIAVWFGIGATLLPTLASQSVEAGGGGFGVGCQGAFPCFTTGDGGCRCKPNTSNVGECGGVGFYCAAPLYPGQCAGLDKNGNSCPCGVGCEP